MNKNTPPQRDEAIPSWARWLGDGPWAAAALWTATIVLIYIDVELLKPIVSRAVQSGGTIGHWLATLGIAGAMAGILALAAELLMRFVERRRAGWLWGSVLLGAVWVAILIALFRIRERFYLDPNSGSATASRAATETATDDANLWAALFLSMLMLLSGLCAAALVVVTHDHRQGQRRKIARRRWVLATLHRWVSWQRGIHTRRRKIWQNRADDLEVRRAAQVTKITKLATSRKQAVRLRIATALASPAATSGVFNEQEG